MLGSDEGAGAFAAAARTLSRTDPQAYLFGEWRTDVRISLPETSTPEVQSSRQWGARVCVPGRPGRERFCAAPSPQALERLCAGARLPQDGARAFQEAGSRPIPDVVPRALQALETLRRRCAGSDARLGARWTFFLQEVLVAGADGGVARDRRAGSWLRLEVSTARGGRSLVERAFGLEVPCDEELQRMMEQALGRAEAQERARKVRPGPQRLVLAPGVGGVVVHELVGHALEADTVLRGASRLTEWGDPVAAPSLTILDDPRRGRAGWRVDDEGTRAGPTSLIERGRLAGRLHDRTTAAAAGTRSTGHGRRASFRESVHPRMGCTFLAPGDLDPEEVLKKTARGILVRHMRVGDADPRAGRAWFHVDDADEIFGGRLGNPLRPFLLELDAHAFLKTTDLVGHDLAFDRCIGSCVHHGQPLAVSVGAPTLRIGVATVIA